MTDVSTLNLPLAPHGNHLLVAPVEDGPERPGAGLLLPPGARRIFPTRRAVVLAVGEGLRQGDGLVPAAPATPGALIAHKAHAGTDLAWGGAKLVVMRWDDVVGVLMDDDAERVA